MNKIKEELKYRKELPIGIKTEIRARGIFTGSKMFGGYVRGESDIDLILPPDFKYNFQDLRSYGYYNSDYNGMDYQSLYVIMKKEVYNLLFTKNEKEYNRWVKATDTMEAMSRLDKNTKQALLNKSSRCRLFEVLKDIL